MNTVINIKFPFQFTKLCCRKYWATTNANIKNITLRLLWINEISYLRLNPSCVSEFRRNVHDKPKITKI